MVAYHSFVIVALLAKSLVSGFLASPLLLKSAAANAAMGKFAHFKTPLQKLKADPKACLWCSLVLICYVGDDLLCYLHQHAAHKHEYDFSFVHRNALLSAFALLHKDDVYL